ncbi:serine/threonine-protein kinase [Pendulispora albinea]|uniref:non-specific serine/threonine protein kinase n=1 Tax=Pendulispora albinea TaxID=2741071 RepID=A0ABZ2M0U1_9BACT
MNHAEQASFISDRAEVLSHSRYEVVTKIAAGGMATVYLGRARGAKGFSRVVAIKRAHPHLLESAAFRGMLLAEARLASHIHHPNVAGVIDVEEFDDELLLVMDYVEGLALSDLVRGSARKNESIPLPIAFRIVLDAAAGLHAAHTTCDELGQPLGIVHRDVSPQNVLVGLDGMARVVDFGIAKATALTPQMTQIEGTTDGARKGKLGYMAPEYVSDSIVTPQADVFALGVILWEMVCGRRLFRAGDAIRTLRAVLRGPIPVPSSVNSQVGEALDEVVLKALARNPKERYKTALELAEALETAARKDHDVASAARTGAWVEDLAHEALEKRRALFRETMSSLRMTSAFDTFCPRSMLVPASSSAERPQGVEPTPAHGTGALPDHRARAVSNPEEGAMCHTGSRSCSEVESFNSSRHITSMPVRAARWSVSRIAQLAAVASVFVVAGVGIHGELSMRPGHEGLERIVRAERHLSTVPAAASPVSAGLPARADHPDAKNATDPAAANDAKGANDGTAAAAPAPATAPAPAAPATEPAPRAESAARTEPAPRADAASAGNASSATSSAGHRASRPRPRSTNAQGTQPPSTPVKSPVTNPPEPATEFNRAPPNPYKGRTP